MFRVSIPKTILDLQDGPDIFTLTFKDMSTLTKHFLVFNIIVKDNILLKNDIPVGTIEEIQND